MNKKISKISLVFLLGILYVSCSTSVEKFNTAEGKEIRKKVDQTIVQLDSVVANFNKVVRIDHSRLAEGAGTYTPPAIVTIFSNPKVNSKLIKTNQLVAMDLPYKVLCYSEPDLAKASVAYTSPEFIMKRHGVSESDLTDYAKDINSVINTFPKTIISTTDLNKVSKDFGIITMKSDFDFDTTMEKLKAGINSQGDTEIFGEVNYKNEAVTFNIELDPTTLILFGAPAPGGKAMHECPKLGLDAFCQKILVFEKENTVYVAYNDIVAFSELYYDEWTIPQKVINKRIKGVFEKAITE